jgi:hypothetical protein
MTDQTPETLPEAQEPFIPPQYLLILAGIAFFVAIVVAFTQADFGVVGFGALALGLLALVGWALMAPDQLRAMLTGRGARFGGLSFFVTVVVLVAMVLVYVFVRNQNVQWDLTQRDDFSLNSSSEAVISAMASDPTVPSVKLIAFYGAAQSARRDLDTVLFEDYKQTSGGKIDYEFIDPDRNPQVAQQYGITQNGQIAVVPLADGQPVVDSAERVNFLTQDDLTNAILKASAQGDFRAYILNVEDGISLTPGDAGSISELSSILTDQFNWTVQDVTALDLLQPSSGVTLNDPNADGEVMAIIGGSRPLSEQELGVITDYLDNGGQLIIFAGDSFTGDLESLATGEGLTDYLRTNFGVSFRNDVVIDTTQNFNNNPLVPFTGNLDPSSFITSNGLQGQGALVFEFPHSIELADTPPANVIVTPIIQSSGTAFAKTDLEAVLNQDISQTDADLQGPVVLGATAENTQTGARVALFGSTALVQDFYTQLQQVGVANLPVTFNAFVWATNYNDFFQRTTIVSDPRPQDTPIFADAQTLRMTNFITLVLLPFGILAVGLLVWWNNRERRRDSRS